MLSDKEIKLEILRSVLESGSELTKSNPLPKCEEYYKWVCKANENSPNKSKTIRKNLTDKKE
jgi:hypothetical protein